ncbi:secreted RxLR effector protein 78-like [Rutidosis leptorrhynchoides]|uniref:secreted RxLR effector protein 78-like n=1 Tax=Rutidosis leptorrhynchoides TaxID=125765 RepID=UPI003A99B12C
MVFKVDFKKAFDSISWDFWDEMMVLMGFGSKWRSWITSCLKSASISILVNGSPTKEFKLGRGVRQGDLLSPFLFIIAAEGLNWLAKSAVHCNLYEGVEIGMDRIPISHLQYADDTIFFGK